MSHLNNCELGGLLQAYARTQAREGRVSATKQFEGKIERRFRDRIDVLGIDTERLLAVDAADVLSELEFLEREAALEDASIRRVHDKYDLRKRELNDDETKAPRRDHRVHTGGHRTTTRYGPGGKRGQR